MRTGSKLLASLLALAMTTSMSVTAFAEAGTETPAFQIAGAKATAGTVTGEWLQDYKFNQDAIESVQVATSEGTADITVTTKNGVDFKAYDNQSGAGAKQWYGLLVNFEDAATDLSLVSGKPSNYNNNAGYGIEEVDYTTVENLGGETGKDLALWLQAEQSGNEIILSYDNGAELSLTVTVQEGEAVPTPPVDKEDIPVDVTIPENATKLTPDDVAAGVVLPEGTTGVSVESAAPSATGVEKIVAALEKGINGSKFNNKFAFGAFDLNLQAQTASGNQAVENGQLKKPQTFDVAVAKANLPEQQIPTNRFRVLREHNGQVSVLGCNAAYDKDGNLQVNFATDRFSTFQLAVLDTSFSSAGGGEAFTDDRHYDNKEDRVPRFLMSDAEDASKGDIIEFTAHSSTLIPTEFVEIAKEKSLQIKMLYLGTTYTGSGKSFPKPQAGRIYYDVDEFIKMLDGKTTGGNADNSGSNSGNNGGNTTEKNPSTGAADFTGIALALAVVSTAGIMAARKSK